MPVYNHSPDASFKMLEDVAFSAVKKFCFRKNNKPAFPLIDIPCPTKSVSHKLQNYMKENSIDKGGWGIKPKRKS